VANTAREAGAAANHASANKNTQYSQLSSTHIFFPEAIDTAGTWHYQAVELIQEVGRRTANITGDAREMHLPVPALAAVHCTTEGKCGLIPKHVHYMQLACCNSLFSSLFLMSSCLLGLSRQAKKIIIIIINSYFSTPN